MMVLLVFYYSDMVNTMDVVVVDYYYFDFVDMDPLRLVHNTVMVAVVVVVIVVVVVVDMAVDPAARAIVSQTIAAAVAVVS